MSQYNVPESAVDALHEHTSSSDGISDRDIERVADFIVTRLMHERGALSKEAVRAFDLFEDRIADAIDSFCKADESGASFVARMSLTDPQEAGDQLQNISRGVILTIARDYFDEFADAARNLGWIE